MKIPVISFLFFGIGAVNTSPNINIPFRNPESALFVEHDARQVRLITPEPVIISNAVRSPEDYSPIFQHDIDSCIQHNIPEYEIPAGRYICRETLILAKPNREGYSFFSLILRGKSTFAGADGTGTILDFSNMNSGFGIGVQAGKGVQIIGIKLIGAFNYKFPGAYTFYNTRMKDFSDGKCRDSQYSPYFALVIDPFGPKIPGDGGYPGLSSWYKGKRSGSTGTVIENCFLTNWVGGIITSPNGLTQNAEMTIADKIQFANMKICVAGCQDQEKMNRVSNVECWGVVHTCFTTGLYGAGSVGNWYLDHWNIAGYTQEIVYNNQQGYFPSYFSDIFAESIARIGFIASINGTTFSNSSINFADYTEAGSYTADQISGYGVTFIGCQLRMYGTAKPITIATGVGSNNIHFRDCSFEAVPIYPQSYPYGTSDFSNCYVGGSSPADILNPIGPRIISQPRSIYAYPTTSNVAAKAIYMGIKSKFSRSGANFSTIIQSDSGRVGDVLLVTTDNYTYTVAGIITAKGPGNFTVSYSPEAIDPAKMYAVYTWKTLTR
jgi:hypothetical protein